MASLPVPNTMKVEIFYTLDGQRLENTLHFLNTGTFSGGEIEGLGSTLLTWVTTDLMPNLSDQLSFRFLQLTDLRTLDGGVVPVVPEAPVPGGTGGNPVPNNCALCVAFSTGGRGRASRGRNYVPGIVETEVDKSIVSEARANAILSSYLNLVDLMPLESQPWVWVLVSRQLGGVQRNPPVTTQIVSAYLSDTVIDSQRRRLPRRGS